MSPSVSEDIASNGPTATPSSTSGKPHVLIVGGGLGGLMLALLLERANIPYQVFERASKARALGSAMSLGANILPVFEQLGILEDVKNISLPVYEQRLYEASMKRSGALTMKDYKDITGYDTYVFPRPELHQLMLERVPVEKVLVNKKVLSMEQNQLGVMIRCADGTQYHGDILVGADGAYSSVRQALYKKLDAKGSLPKSDTESLALGFITMVGVTHALDPEKYPCLKETVVNFSQVIGGHYMSWHTLTVPGNRVCWNASIQLTSEAESRACQFRNSEWGPESIENTIKVFKECKVPIGGTMGDLIEATPQDLISRVYLEEKLFETWQHGRTALIGDGAVNAMQDAVILANVINDLESTNPADIKVALESYQEQRYPHAKFEYMNSKMISKIMTGQKWNERLLRHIAFNLPGWVRMRGFIKSAVYRPQASFLPFIEKRGTGSVLPQAPSHRQSAKPRRSMTEKRGKRATVVSI
ncbi:hypothetical protein BGZ65_000127 [Modicella reniformis]|uniref:FAD-binding domain-containing protein n=1 Tax=Modicella reniformis TaxID=1440133 RepID=A0A9P6SUE8_9FUNG|nr:hypothetical protein BGZ65_000127 [Modicella reniformis]